MKPPTKYENMRMNRAAAEYRAAHGPADAPIPAHGPDKTPAEPPKQPTMTVGGEKYAEAPWCEPFTCSGCAFARVDCRPANRIAERVFGGDCNDRHVIYVRAL